LASSLVLANQQKDFFNFARKGLCAGVLIEDNKFDENVGCPKAVGNVVINCGSTTPRNIVESFEEYDSSEPAMNVFKDTLKSPDTSYKLQEDFMNFMANEALNYSKPLVGNLIDYVKSSSFFIDSSSFSESVDMNKITVQRNTFNKNYAIVNSGIMLNGVPRLRIYNNSFEDNTIPLGNYWKLNPFTNAGYYKSLGKYPYFSRNESATPLFDMPKLAQENSAVMVSFSGFVEIDSCIFRNNSGGSFYFPDTQASHDDYGQNIGGCLVYTFTYKYLVCLLDSFPPLIYKE
jgi:hypothetical protein